MAVDITLLSSTSITNIATNFERVKAALQDAVSREGNTPNQLNADLDLNNNDILNINALNAKSIWINGEPIGGGGGGGGGPIPPGGLQQNLNMNGYNISNVGRLDTSQLFVNGVPVTGGGGGGGSSTLAGLSDVLVTSTPQNGSALVWSSVLGKWRPVVIDDGGVIIPPGSITEDKFEEGITPVRIVNTLPTTDNYEGRTVFLTSDGKLYRYHSGNWTTAVPALDISGQLQDAQLAAINAVKIAGQITGTQISDNAISSPKIAAGAITAGKLDVGAVQAGNIAAGAITADNIEANSITAGKLAANSVTSDKIVAGAVSAAKLSVSTLSAITANLGAVTAGSISGISISGTTITGGTVRTNAGSTRVELSDTANALRVIVGGLNTSSFGTPDGAGVVMHIDSQGTAARINGRHSVGFGGGALEVSNNAAGVAIEARNTTPTSTGHGARIQAFGGGTGLVGVASGGGAHAFFAEAGGYAPFTGVHESFISKDDLAEVGDIVHSVGNVIATKGVDDALLEVASTDQVNKRGNYGVIAVRSEFGVDDVIVALDVEDERRPYLSTHFDRLAVNGLGEGLVAVCGRGGDIEVGDYITTSTLRGKGQRQNDSNGDADDLLRRHTVAQATQAVTFDNPDEVKLISCVYRCG